MPINKHIIRVRQHPIFKDYRYVYVPSTFSVLEARTIAFRVVFDRVEKSLYEVNNTTSEVLKKQFVYIGGECAAGILDQAELDDGGVITR